MNNETMEMLAKVQSHIDACVGVLNLESSADFVNKIKQMALADLKDAIELQSMLKLVLLAKFEDALS